MTFKEKLDGITKQHVQNEPYKTPGDWVRLGASFALSEAEGKTAQEIREMKESLNDPT